VHPSGLGGGGARESTVSVRLELGGAKGGRRRSNTTTLKDAGNARSGKKEWKKIIVKLTMSFLPNKNCTIMYIKSCVSSLPSLSLSPSSSLPLSVSLPLTFLTRP
jgi:hypothetical protein